MGGGVTVHYNKEIKTIIKLTKEDGDVINITNDKDVKYINDILDDRYVNKLEIFSGVEKYNFSYESCKNWYNLTTIVIHEGVTFFPFNFYFDGYYSSILERLVIYGKDTYLFYHGNVSYLYTNLVNYLNIYVDKSNVAELNKYRYNNNLNYTVYSLEEYHE